jgi:hypothetical protein
MAKKKETRVVGKDLILVSSKSTSKHAGNIREEFCCICGCVHFEMLAND